MNKIHTILESMQFFSSALVDQHFTEHDVLYSMVVKGENHENSLLNHDSKSYCKNPRQAFILLVTDIILDCLHLFKSKYIGRIFGA